MQPARNGKISISRQKGLCPPRRMDHMGREGRPRHSGSPRGAPRGAITAPLGVPSDVFARAPLLQRAVAAKDRPPLPARRAASFHLLAACSPSTATRTPPSSSLSVVPPIGGYAPGGGGRGLRGVVRAAARRRPPLFADDARRAARRRALAARALAQAVSTEPKRGKSRSNSGSRAHATRCARLYHSSCRMGEDTRSTSRSRRGRTTSVSCRERCKGVVRAEAMELATAGASRTLGRAVFKTNLPLPTAEHD